MRGISALYLKGNPGVRHVSMYRKTFTGCLPALVQLDDRPIGEIDRMLADAFNRGGVEEEKRVKAEYADRRVRAAKLNREENAKLIEKGKIARKAEMAKMMATLKGKKDQMVARRAELKDQLRGDEPFRKEEREKKEIEVRKIDQELKTEFYKILEEKGEDRPSVPTPEVPQQVHEDHRHALRQEEERKAQIRKEWVEDQEAAVDESSDKLA
jgi:hypothetical protein